MGDETGKAKPSVLRGEALTERVKAIETVREAVRFAEGEALTERVKAIEEERRQRNLWGEEALYEDPRDPIDFSQVPGPHIFPEEAALMIVHGLSDRDASREWKARFLKKGDPERKAKSAALRERVKLMDWQCATDPERPVTVEAEALIAGIIVSDRETGPCARIVKRMMSLRIAYRLSADLMARYHKGLHLADIMKYHRMDHAQVDELLESVAKGGLWQEPPAGAARTAPVPPGQSAPGEAKPSGRFDGVPADAREPWSAEVQAYVARARREGWRRDESALFAALLALDRRR